ncbi:hypothetical protein WOC76_04130 [Methylocystis sp. IM3]|jgi:hypothetical protein|uniref:hypothetical protein n=1 Tax=unclassified Methylocystis TaxID=2625913 RepID=UPI000F96FDC1|nr:MAG: hypothetical protein EKK29_22245 [Hyphomicrobiales bacterium]
MSLLYISGRTNLVLRRSVIAMVSQKRNVAPKIKQLEQFSLARILIDRQVGATLCHRFCNCIAGFGEEARDEEKSSGRSGSDQGILAEPRPDASLFAGGPRQMRLAGAGAPGAF